MPPNLTIVVYHDISDASNRMVKGLKVSTREEVFESHLEHFRKSYDVVSPAQVLGTRLPKRPLLLTFDDAYRSVLEVAAPLLKQASLPSLFFLNAGPITSKMLPFDNLLCFAAEEMGLAWMSKLLGQPPRKVMSLSELIGTFVPSMSTADITSARRSICAELQVSESELSASSDLLLKENEVKQLVDFGVEIGNHSLNHRFFRSLSEDQLRSEIIGGQAELQRLTSRPIKYLSIPYGNRSDATSSALEVARESGHDLLFLAGARSNRLGKYKGLLDRIGLTNEPASFLPFKLHVYPLLRTLPDWLPVSRPRKAANT